ncbi:TetR-like C-terminal domain-containing protein [Rhodococcus sp. 2.95]
MPLSKRWSPNRWSSCISPWPTPFPHTPTRSRVCMPGCSAYVEFGISEPARYRVLFGWSRPKGQSPQSDTRGLVAFNTLVTNLDACVAAGRSASTDTFVDAVSIWTSLHGQVMLRADLPEFPWPSTDTVGEMVRSLARLVN